ncbi:carbohydrate esterase family 1 protein [Daldinia bambusicola]|nr:carbohydrate esterase family 1 protein [Daldinia bambusicola]
MLSFSLASVALASLAGTVQGRSAGCGQKPSFEAGSFKNYTTSEGREYRVWLPANYDSDKVTPLILSYHGANRVIDQQVKLDRLSDPFFNTDHIVVYLQGLEASRPGHTVWEGAPDCNSDDIGFTSDVLDAVSEELCVNRRRIYATGKSQGGGFVGRLACDAGLSKRIAAFAPVSGAYYIKEINKEADCHPETVEVPCDAGRSNIPILAFHGGADATINYNGGFRSGACLPAISSWAKQWAARDNLDQTPKNTTIPGAQNGVQMSYGGGLVSLVYDGDNIGHAWPSTQPNSDNDGKDLAAFNASTSIMEFFRSHRLE